MKHRVFAAKTRYAESQMLDNDTCRLTVDEVTVCERVFEHGDNRVNVVGRLWANVFEYEGQRFETAGPYVELRSTVLVEDCRNTRESWGTSAYGDY